MRESNGDAGFGLRPLRTYLGRTSRFANLC